MIVNKCLHYLLALQVLNLSFSNLAVKEPVFSQPGTETNQIDSAIEYITEDILGWDDFIPEKDKAPADKHFIKVSNCFLYCERPFSPAVNTCNNNTRVNTIFIPDPLSKYNREINPPPPKAISLG